MLEQTQAVGAETLSGWLKAQYARDDLADIVHRFADAAAGIATRLRHAPLHGEQYSSGQINVQGEEQKQLDIISHDIVAERLATAPQVAALVSEEMPNLIVPEHAEPAAPFVLCFDPLDGSSNLEVNGPVGSIFSVLERMAPNDRCDEAAVLAAAGQQRAAGYVLYGPATLLVLTLGKTVASFALDETIGTFHLLQDGLTVPQRTDEFSINMAHQRFFPVPVADYVADCLAGEAGPRGKNYTMRWAAAMVADVHRLFVRGGIFIYPALNRPGGERGKLRFLYEANPMAWLVEVAGGGALSNGTRLLDVAPESLHQRVPVALGSAEEIAALERHYSD